MERNILYNAVIAFLNLYFRTKTNTDHLSQVQLVHLANPVRWVLLAVLVSVVVQALRENVVCVEKLELLGNQVQWDFRVKRGHVDNRERKESLERQVKWDHLVHLDCQERGDHVENQEKGDQWARPDSLVPEVNRT